MLTYIRHRIGTGKETTKETGPTAPMLRSPYVREGRGKVPATSLCAAAWKELCELPGAMQGATVAHLGSQLDFTPTGLTFEQFRGFFDEALAAVKKVEPIVEAGNK